MTCLILGDQVGSEVGMNFEYSCLTDLYKVLNKSLKQK
jgi:hypothetical protein